MLPQHILVGTKKILRFESWPYLCVDFCVFVSGVRAEEAPRGRVPPEDGGALRMCPLHSELSQGLLTHCRTVMSTVM